MSDEVNDCPICGAEIQATETIKIDYSRLTVALSATGGWLVIDLFYHHEDERTEDLRIYCANDHTAEEMEMAALRDARDNAGTGTEPRRVCQDCYHEELPTDYLPDDSEEGRCDRCGDQPLYIYSVEG